MTTVLNSRLSEHIERLLLCFASDQWSDTEIFRATGDSFWINLDFERSERTDELRDPALAYHLAELANGVPSALVNQLEKLERALLRPCATCQRDVIPPAGPVGGRPRKYCSSACRQAAYRARRKNAAPPQEASENQRGVPLTRDEPGDK